MIERITLRFEDCEVKFAGAEPGTFTGYGAVFGNVDDRNDVLEPGAFAATIGQWAAKGRMPKMLLNHGGLASMLGPTNMSDLIPVGQWKGWTEDSKGLEMAGRLFALGTERGQYLHEGMKSGELDGLSIGFKVARNGADLRAGVRHLMAVDVREVSIVTFPANDRARVQAVKFSVEQLRELESDLRDAGLSRKDSVIAASYFQKLLQREAGAPGEQDSDESLPDDVAAQILEGASKQVEAIHLAAVLSSLRR